MSDNLYRDQLIDSVVSNSSLTDDFSDAEAIPFIEWATVQADRIGSKIDSDEVYEEAQRIFSKWLRTLLSLISRRQVADDEWREKMYARLEEYAPILDASAPTPDQRQTLQDNINADTLAYMQLLLPMVEPQQPAIVESTESLLGQVADVVGDDLTDVARVDDDVESASILPGLPMDSDADKLSSMDDVVSSDDE